MFHAPYFGDFKMRKLLTREHVAANVRITVLGALNGEVRSLGVGYGKMRDDVIQVRCNELSEGLGDSGASQALNKVRIFAYYGLQQDTYVLIMNWCDSIGSFER